MGDLYLSDLRKSIQDELIAEIKASDNKKLKKALKTDGEIVIGELFTIETFTTYP